LTGPVELVFVRHGESVRNLSCDLAREGRPEELERQMVEEQEEAAWPLTPLGHEQAIKAGAWLKANLPGDYQAAYVSPFRRARQTADDLGLGLDWIQDDRLREREWGEYTTPGTPEYTPEQYLADLAVCADLEWKTPYPDAESIMDLVPRVSDFLRDALRRTPSGRIIAVTHGGTIRALQVVLEQLHRGERLAPDRRLSNCCVVLYRIYDIDLERMEWKGEVRTAHPVLPGVPQTNWEPVEP
jgi:broad specificity phosphatase PhoE